MLNIYFAACIIFMLILWSEAPKGNEMATLEILTALVKGGMTPIGACAMGGNMMAESGMKSNIAQRGLLVGLSDEQYTAAADTRTIDFIGDSVGYGLCQWTLKTRKRHLLEYAKSMGASVGDEFTQVQFCLAELKTDYPDLWDYLQTTSNLREATSRICKEYERPAVNNVEARFSYAQQMYKDYGAMLEKIAESPDNFYIDPVGELKEYGKWYDHGDPVGEPGPCGLEDECRGRLMAAVRSGDQTPEAAFLAAHLNKLGYDVLWLGLDACLRDFQQKRGLTVDGVCGEKTWREILT